MKTFPRFWFESNLYFGWVNNIEELEFVFEEYKSQMSRDEVLDTAVNYDDTLTEFGLRIEHQGKITLRKFLEDNDITFPKIESIADVVMDKLNFYQNTKMSWIKEAHGEETLVIDPMDFHKIARDIEEILKKK
jgi:hypothetical protein